MGWVAGGTRSPSPAGGSFPYSDPSLFDHPRFGALSSSKALSSPSFHVCSATGCDTLYADGEGKCSSQWHGRRGKRREKARLVSPSPTRDALSRTNAHERLLLPQKETRRIALFLVLVFLQGLATGTAPSPLAVRQHLASVVDVPCARRFVSVIGAQNTV